MSSQDQRTLSLIIPVYNEQKHLEAFLRAVDAVQIPGVSKELVIVDDASSDGSRAMI